MDRGQILFVVGPMMLDGEYIDYPWAADMGALCCAARAAAAGWRVDVFDSLAQPDSGWFDEPDPEDGTLHRVAGIPFGDVAPRALEFVAAPPDLVVVANHPFMWDSRRLASGMTAALAAAFDGVPVVMADCAVGGMLYVEREADRLLESFPGVAAVVAYSGEPAFADPAGLIAAIRAGSRLVSAPAEGAPATPMWDAIDIGARHAFNVRFFQEGDRPNPFGIGAGALPMLSSSGCAFDCVFCTSNPGRSNHGPGAYRAVPLADLEDRLYLMKRASGLRRAVFLDDAANLRPDFPAMLRMLNAMDLSYEFPNGLRADRLDAATIDLMKGRVTTLSVSCETADPAALRDQVGKRMDPAAVEAVAAAAAMSGIPLMVHFIIGFPWETLADVRRTLDFARQLFEKYGAVPAVQFATPVPGSRLWEMVPGAIEPEGQAAFQHSPSFVPAAMRPGDLEAAMTAFSRRMEAARLSKVIINVTYDCINSCEFCAVSNRVRKQIPTERIIAILDEHRARGIENVDFDGGEPMLHPGILDVVRHAALTGFRQVNVTSNGRKLADPATARALFESGITSLLISLHGDCPGVHDAITGKPGSFVETLAGIDNILALNRAAANPVDFGVNVTICRHNLDNIEALAAMMAARGVPKMNFQFLTPFGAAAAALVPDQAMVARHVENIIRSVGAGMRIYVVNAQMCLFAPEFESHLLNDLQKLGRTMVFVWEEEVNLFKYLAEKRVRRPQCTECPHFLVCDGFYEFPETGAVDGEDGGVNV